MKGCVREGRHAGLCQASMNWTSTLDFCSVQEHLRALKTGFSCSLQSRQHVRNLFFFFFFVIVVVLALLSSATGAQGL